MSQAERDAIDIFGLLYPMLTSGQKGTSEARTAFGIAEKYKQHIKDSAKLTGYDAILRIVEKQLKAERAPVEGKRPRRTVPAARAEAYYDIVRFLGMTHAMDGIRLGIGKNSATPVPVAAQKPALVAPKKAAK
jgi:hypothetical protein